MNDFPLELLCVCDTVHNIKADLVLINRCFSWQKTHICILAYVSVFLGLKGYIVMLWLEECFTSV